MFKISYIEEEKRKKFFIFIYSSFFKIILQVWCGVHVHEQEREQ